MPFLITCLTYLIPALCLTCAGNASITWFAPDFITLCFSWFRNKMVPMLLDRKNFLQLIKRLSKSVYEMNLISPEIPIIKHNKHFSNSEPMDYFLDGNENQENFCWRIIRHHHPRRCEELLWTIWTGKFEDYFSDLRLRFLICYHE